MSIYLYFIFFFILLLFVVCVCSLESHQYGGFVKYHQYMFCEPPTPSPQKKEKKKKGRLPFLFVGVQGGAEEDTYLNFMTENCQFYSHRIALTCMNRHAYVTHI